MFVDILIVAYPMRLYHVIQPICFGVCYGVFSYIYYLFGGVNEWVHNILFKIVSKIGKSLFFRHGIHFVYPVLNWATPKKALTTVATINLLFIVVHVVHFCIYKLRVFIQRKLFVAESAWSIDDMTLESRCIVWNCLWLFSSQCEIVKIYLLHLMISQIKIIPIFSKNKLL